MFMHIIVYISTSNVSSGSFISNLLSSWQFTVVCNIVYQAVIKQIRLNKIELFKILSLSGVKYLVGTALGLSSRLLLGEYLKQPNFICNLLGVKCFEHIRAIMFILYYNIK